MSYRNPTQYIDRQSGQIEQNLQKTLAGIGTGVVSSINKIHADNAAKTAAIRAEADKRVADAQNSIMQTQSKNPTADFGDLDEQLNLMNRLLMKDPAKRTAEEKTFINGMENIGDNMANMLKNTAMSQEAMMEQINKIPGTMGAVDPKANPEQYAKLSVLANQTEGRTKARYKTNKNGQIVFSLDVYQKTKDGEKFVGSVINDNVATTQMPTVVPNISKDIAQNIQNTINLLDPTSELSPVLSEDRKEILYHQDKFGRRVDPKKFRNQLEAQSESTLSQFTDRKIASLYNNVLNPGDTDFSYDAPLSNDQKLKAKKALVDYMMKQPSVTKVLGNIVESKISKPTPPKKISAADKLYNDQVELADTSIKDMDELMKTPLKEIGNRKFTMDEQGAFIQVINRHRSKADGKVQTMEDIKADFIREEGKDAWDEENYTAELGYVKESGGKKIIVQLPVGSYEQKTETLVDLLYPNLKTTRRNKMLNIIRGNEGEITLNRSELP
ncbi:MAG: hypothetical protein OET18_13530 [Desulfobacterales bacterium]|nr:hypothetical protein [Desulfobacterales bacterium]